MKIKDFAESRSLTKQAVYKAINRAGLSAKDLTDKSGSITRKGMQILSKMFPAASRNRAAAADHLDDLDESTNSPDQIAQLTAQNKELSDKCKEWETRYFDLLEKHTQETDQLRKLIAREQELRYAAERKGFFRRLFAGRKESEIKRKE